MFGGHTSVGANFASVVTVTPKFQDTGGPIKVWTTEAAVYGLPSKCSCKASSDTPCAALYTALLEFLQAECKKAADGLSGQMSMVGGRHGMGISWTCIIEEIKFEGEPLPRDATPICAFLVDGEPFQATGKLSQSVNISQQNALGVLAGITPTDTKYAVADAMFAELDRDQSGTLDPQEIAVYLMNRGESPTSVQDLFAKLDTNADGKVTKEEWRAGWLAGHVSKQDSGCRCVVL